MILFAVIHIAAVSFGNRSIAAAEAIQYQRGDRRDPFIPLIGPGIAVAKTQKKMDLNIEGIIIDKSQGSMALINGQFYKEGDTVEDMNIISIFVDRVILSQNDEEKTIWLREEILDGQEHNLENS